MARNGRASAVAGGVGSNIVIYPAASVEWGGRGVKRVFVLVCVVGLLVGIPGVQASTPWSELPLTHVPAISAAVAAVSLPRLYQDLYALQNFSTRYAFSSGVVAASQYIYDQLVAASPRLQVSYQDFMYRGTAMRNVIAVLPGLDPTNSATYVLGGHYDSINFDTDPNVWAPGVDDNGSGTVATIEAARVLSGYEFNATLVFALFTAEELGLVGSDVYARRAAGTYEDVGLYVNMDMIGYDPLDQKGIDVITDFASEPEAVLFSSLVADYGIDVVPTVVVSPGTTNSDHASFWAQGFKAI